jgi:hypothetical protein
VTVAEAIGFGIRIWYALLDGIGRVTDVEEMNRLLRNLKIVGADDFSLTFLFNGDKGRAVRTNREGRRVVRVSSA